MLVTRVVKAWTTSPARIWPLASPKPPGKTSSTTNEPRSSPLSLSVMLSPRGRLASTLWKDEPAPWRLKTSIFVVRPSSRTGSSTGSRASSSSSVSSGRGAPAPRRLPAACLRLLRPPRGGPAACAFGLRPATLALGRRLRPRPAGVAARGAGAADADEGTLRNRHALPEEQPGRRPPAHLHHAEPGALLLHRRKQGALVLCASEDVGQLRHGFQQDGRPAVALLQA
mmetsp:Transcript_9479/g.26650  ORF Transcript_9479/g.26650 Transcript_9479/m.26650 type:complete len:227 (+) Transcript_9479:194-874(+)